jgi:dipeptidyl aminopeptidase/acylaminoacyl peptidase
VYAVGGTLRAVAFDATRREVGGAATVVEGVNRTRLGSNIGGLAQYSLSATGSLAYVAGPVSTASAPPRDLALYDTNGGVESLNLPPMLYESPRISPNGQEIAVSTLDDDNVNVWLYDLARKTPLRQLTLQGRNRHPIWSADGLSVAFPSDREGDLAIFSQAADGSRPAERLTRPEPGTAHVPQAWSRGDEHMLFSASTGSGYWLEVLAARTKTIERFAADLQSTTLPGAAAFSPDGAWVAYQAGESTQARVRIQPFSGTGAVHQLPVAGRNPRWSPSGTELFFTVGAAIFRIPVSTRPKVAFGSPSVLVKGIPMGFAQRGYDVLDDARFVGITVATGYTPSTAASIRQIDVILNWGEELRARVPAHYRRGRADSRRASWRA